MWIIACLVMVHCAASGGEPGSDTSKRLRLTFAGKEALVTIFDHPTSRDLLSRLPLTLEFRDYVGAEKIGYLEEKLSSDGTSPVETGDFAYYAPWGNMAIFYRGSGRAAGGLIVLGRIESGKSALAEMDGAFTMTLELEK